MPPPSKKQRSERAAIELACEFSECTAVCQGLDMLAEHVGQHIEFMKEQIAAAFRDEPEEEDVDQTKCECPWRDCMAILSVVEDWAHCSRHINFHAYHTYLKAVGDSELRKRNIGIACLRDSAMRNIIPELSEAFICKWGDCSYKVNMPWLFYRHVENHAADPFHEKSQLRACSWAGCKYQCPPNSNVTKLKDHLRSHTMERKCACSKCGALYSVPVRLADHQQRESTGEKSFQCSHCSKQCSSESLLRDHLRKHVNMYGCMFCEMTCPSPSALRIHILYRHSTERPFTCSDCQKTFKTKFDIAAHALTHKYKDMEFLCSVEFCGFNCKSYSAMQKHTYEVHKTENGARIYGCHICAELFSVGSMLSKHLRTVHEIKYPPGHVKFRFAAEADGIRRLVTVRYECFTEEYEECNDETDTTIVSLPEEATNLQSSAQPTGQSDESNLDLLSNP